MWLPCMKAHTYTCIYIYKYMYVYIMYEHEHLLACINGVDIYVCVCIGTTNCLK